MRSDLNSRRAEASFNNNPDTDYEKSLLGDDSPFLVGRRRKRRQIFAAFAANLGGFALGTVLSWTSPALPSLRADNVTFATFPSPHILTLDEESWISSVVPLGAALGGPLGGALTDSVGRKTCICILTFPFIVGWMAIYLAQSVPVIVAGRFVTGVSAGGLSLVAPIFVGEISDPGIRGHLAAGFELMVCVGILFINVLGAYTSWRIQALASAVLPAVIFFLFLVIPESPRYLLSKGSLAEAGRALAWFNGQSGPGKENDEDNYELIKLEGHLLDNHGSNSSYSSTLRVHIQELLHPRTLKPFSIALCLVIFNELTAIDVVTFYTVDLFASAGVSNDSHSHMSTIVLGVVQIAGAATAAVIVDKYGRRCLLLLSQACVTASLATFALFYVLKDHAPDFTFAYLSYLPLISLIAYSYGYVVGLGTVLYLIMGEILPYSTKGLTSGTITVCKWILAFAITKSFDGLLACIGNAGLFACFAGGSAIGLLYTTRMVPETKGKTLEDIQRLFAVWRGERGEPSPRMNKE